MVTSSRISVRTVTGMLLIRFIVFSVTRVRR